MKRDSPKGALTSMPMATDVGRILAGKVAGGAGASVGGAAGAGLGLGVGVATGVAGSAAELVVVKAPKAIMDCANSLIGGVPRKY